MNTPKIGIIILNYNSWKDSIECLESLQKIEYPDYLIVAVDNASSDGSVEKIKSWAERNGIFFAEYDKEVAEQGGTKDLEEDLEKYPNKKKMVMIKNHNNLGYSAGNNVGIRYALCRGADAVMIVNPDIRIEESHALQTIAETLFSRDDIFVAGPKIIGANGDQQSPLKEPTFMKEYIQPFISITLRAMGLHPKGYLEPVKSMNPCKVEKIAGCCLMIRASFLREIGFLDENVFLYCEESILADQVRTRKGHIYFIPGLTVRHLHRRSSSVLWNEFFRSRKYYLTRYRRYNPFQVAIVMAAHKAVSFLVSRR